MIRPPALRKIGQQNLVVNFLAKSAWEERSIIKKKTDAGYINVSSPELTALDLLLFNKWIGFDRATEIITELIGEMKPSVLIRTARQFPVTSTIQRLGYLLDCRLGQGKMASALEKTLSERKVHVVPLAPGNERRGKISARWKIIHNMKEENES